MSWVNVLLMLLFLHISASSAFPIPGPQAPSAVLDVGPAYTNVENVTVIIRLSQPCPGGGGFECFNDSHCDLLVIGDGKVVPSSLEELLVIGDGKVVPSSLEEVRKASEYQIVIVLSPRSTGKVILELVDGFCTNVNGDGFKSGPGSTQTIRFDRRAMNMYMWTNIPEIPVEINNHSRTLQVTNKMPDILLHLEFSQPIFNSSKDVFKALEINQGVLKPIQRKSHGNRRFQFYIANLPSISVTTISFQGGVIIGRSGTPVSSQSITFFYDSVRPRVDLTVLSANNEDDNINLSVQFSKPVVSFRSSSITIVGGTLTRCQELSKNIYILRVQIPKEHVLSIYVPENTTTDVAGNPNFPSNVVYLKNYPTPAISVALSSLTSVGALATLLATGMFSISSLILSAADAYGGRTSLLTSNPSRNLLGMLGHLQVFAMSDWLVVALPIEYHATLRGLWWLIPHAKVPWESHREALSHLKGHIHALKLQGRVSRYTSESFYINFHFQAKPSKNGSLQISTTDLSGHMLSVNTSMYGPPLNAKEYTLYFKNPPHFSPDTNVHGVNNFTGWHDFSMNMFWIGVTGGGLILLISSLLMLLRWRMGTDFKGLLLLPRLGIFLLILALPGICQALGFIFKGGVIGVVVGVLLFSVPISSLLSIALFLAFATFFGDLVRYHERKQRTGGGKILTMLIGTESIGTWVLKDGVSPSFVLWFGSLFEDRKGLPRLAAEVDGPLGSQNSTPKSESPVNGTSGIGRMRTNDSDFDSDSVRSGNIHFSRLQKLAGGLRTAYIVVDLSRRICLGVVFGGLGSRLKWQFSTAILVNTFQLIYLLTLKPYISRRVHIVEATSLLCEVIVFIFAACGSGVFLNRNCPIGAKSSYAGPVMITALMTSFGFHLVNEWYTLMSDILKLSPPVREPSLKMGLHMLARGLVLPFVPHRRWLRFIMHRTGRSGPDSTVIRSSSSLVDPRFSAICEDEEDSLSGEIKLESSFVRPNNTVSPVNLRPKPKDVKPKSPEADELQVLRQLAKASFPHIVVPPQEEEGNSIQGSSISLRFATDAFRRSEFLSLSSEGDLELHTFGTALALTVSSSTSEKNPKLSIVEMISEEVANPTIDKER